MNQWFRFLAGMSFLLFAVSVTGCAPMPYVEHHYVETEVIIIHEPVPWPDPGPVVHAPPPPPPRKRPLTPADDSGNPRTKTPRNDRSHGNTVVARGDDPPEYQPPRSDRKPVGNRIMKRR